MTLKLLFFSALVGVALSNSYRVLSKVYENHQELPCLAKGGMCVRTWDCPSDKRSPEKGLCPVNQKQGFECCYSVPLSETGCRANGGECMSRSSRCPEHLTYHRATDCLQNEKCCILVRS